MCALVQACVLESSMRESMRVARTCMAHSRPAPRSVMLDCGTICRLPVFFIKDQGVCWMIG